MNLEQTINFIKDMIEKSDDAAAARSYQKILDWLNELLRFRLFLSEYEKEYVLTNKKWHKNKIERCIDKYTTKEGGLLIAESIIDIYLDALFCLKRVRGILDCSMEDKDVHAKRIIDAFLEEHENES